MGVKDGCARLEAAAEDRCRRVHINPCERPFEPSASAALVENPAGDDGAELDSARLNGNDWGGAILEKDEAAGVLKGELADAIFLEEVTSHISRTHRCALEVEEHHVLACHGRGGAGQCSCRVR